LFKMATQVFHHGVSMYKMYYNLNWFIHSSLLLSTVVPFW
jgi:hypothetical protein